MSNRESWAPPLGNRSLEEAFFLREDKKLLDSLTAIREMEDTKRALSEVSGIKNDLVLERLVSLGVSPEVVASLAVVPLIEVAWADGRVDDKERTAILDGLRASGVPAGGVEVELVESWLNRRPDPNLLEAWAHYVKYLSRAMNDTERAAFKAEILKSTRAIAEVSGGFAGLRKVSAGERDMLEKLQKAFD